MSNKPIKKTVKAWAVVDKKGRIPRYTHNPFMSYVEGPTLSITDKQGLLPTDEAYIEVPCTISYQLTAKKKV